MFTIVSMLEVYSERVGQRGLEARVQEAIVRVPIAVT